MAPQPGFRWSLSLPLPGYRQAWERRRRHQTVEALRHLLDRDDAFRLVRPRELQAARLAVRGKTNPEIADALSVALPTAQRLLGAALRPSLAGPADR